MDEPKNPERGLSRNWVAAGITLAGLLAAVYLYQKSGNEETGEPTHISETQKADRAKKKAEWQEMCDALSGKHDALKKRYFNRRGILEGLSKLGTCTDPKSMEFDFPAVCRSIAEGIRKTGPRMNPILHPFYVMLYDELRCAEREFASDSERLKAIDELVAALESTDAIQKYRLLDPKSRIDKDLCSEAVKFVRTKENQDSIVAVRDYLFEKREVLKTRPDSAVKGLIERAEAALKKSDGTMPTDAELKQRFESRLKAITVLAAVPGLCFVEPMTLIGKYDPTLTQEELEKKRTLALPIVRELLLFLKDEPDAEKQKKVMNAVLVLARNMSAERK